MADKFEVFDDALNVAVLDLTAKKHNATFVVRHWDNRQTSDQQGDERGKLFLKKIFFIFQAFLQLVEQVKKS